MYKRDWSTYMIKSVMAEREVAKWPILSTEQLQQYRQSQLVGWQALVLHLPAPVFALTGGVFNTIEVSQAGKRARFYPPFQLNHPEVESAAFQKVWLPEGNTEVTHCVRIGDTAAKGLQVAPGYTVDASFYQGMRIDEEIGFNVAKAVNSLMEHICQQTGQWWLRGRANPFKGMVRLGCEVNKDFTIREVLKHSGPKQIESTWMGVDQSLRPDGFALPLTNGLWLRCCHDVSMGLKADSSLLTFYDAVNNFMTNEDELCVLNLAIAIEIMANKVRLSKGQHPAAFPKLLKTSELFLEKDRFLIQKLYADRNSVAHGGELLYLGKTEAVSIEKYLEVVLAVKSKYLECLKGSAWHRLSQVEPTPNRKLI